MFAIDSRKQYHPDLIRDLNEAAQTSRQVIPEKQIEDYNYLYHVVKALGKDWMVSQRFFDSARYETHIHATNGQVIISLKVSENDGRCTACSVLNQPARFPIVGNHPARITFSTSKTPEKAAEEIMRRWYPAALSYQEENRQHIKQLQAEEERLKKVTQKLIKAGCSAPKHGDRARLYYAEGYCTEFQYSEHSASLHVGGVPIDKMIKIIEILRS